MVGLRRRNRSAPSRIAKSNDQKINPRTFGTRPFSAIPECSRDQSNAKSAVVGFTRVSSMEFGGYGITVNAVCPGIIVTEMGMNNLRDPERVAYFEKVTDLHRLGQPEDVVGPVAFFASDDSAFVTGQALNVDGASSTTSNGVDPL
ncbi:SDR family oxidoreductase [Bradyrhizobium yuanmingense]|nr:SDR family oxidoreductase [Bradyrhizobium yuanmingense]MDF0492795.1 SDR family oxidoreductase [Bradyrhizobium yuanmingense]